MIKYNSCWKNLKDQNMEKKLKTIMIKLTDVRKIWIIQLKRVKNNRGIKFHIERWLNKKYFN